MRIQTTLNRVEKFKSFVYRDARLEERDDGPALVVRIAPRKNSRPCCSGCGRRGPAYDRLEERPFEFVPVWGIVVFLAYRMRRVGCKRCGVRIEMVPWWAQQQGETGDEKVIRFPDRRGGETGSPAQPRPPSRAETRPQIVLRRLKWYDSCMIAFVRLETGVVGEVSRGGTRPGPSACSHVVADVRPKQIKP
jgi:hypothetical protein